MSLKRTYFDVHLDPAEGESTDPVTHRIVYTHGDRCRSELEAQRRGIPLAASYNVTSIGIWCALLREGLFDQGYDVFQARVIDWDAVDPTMNGLPETVDPTQPATPAG